MTESTGYQDSPDTTDGPVDEKQAGNGPATDAPLTTDDSAQKDDGVIRPGNEPD